MKQQSVKRAAEILEPVKSYVQQCWNSPKRYHVFCLVEGEFDKHIYEERLNNRVIEVKIAADDRLNHNRSSVQYLVEDLRKLHPNGRFIGIRDRDYMALLGQACPNGIYVTDKRDLEMMILASSSCQTSDPNLVSLLSVVFPYCVLLAYIRVYAESRNLRNKVNDKMNIAVVYNQQTKTFVTDAKATLHDIYVGKVDPASSSANIDSFVVSENLTSNSPYDICRGHDVIGLLEFVYGKTYSKSEMEKKMESSYDRTDFYNTKLFADISNYCGAYNIDAHVNNIKRS